MENRKKAWAYYHIDAPEDTHGAFKGQRQQLMNYAEQMAFEIIGSSSDMGDAPLWKRNGFRHFIEAAKAGSAVVLLVVNQQCLSHSTMQLAQFQVLRKRYGIEVYSPAVGKI